MAGTSPQRANASAGRLSLPKKASTGGTRETGHASSTLKRQLRAPADPAELMDRGRGTGRGPPRHLRADRDPPDTGTRHGKARDRCPTEGTGSGGTTHGHAAPLKDHGRARGRASHELEVRHQDSSLHRSNGAGGTSQRLDLRRVGRWGAVGRRASPGGLVSQRIEKPPILRDALGGSLLAGQMRGNLMELKMRRSHLLESRPKVTMWAAEPGVEGTRAPALPASAHIGRVRAHQRGIGAALSKAGRQEGSHHLGPLGSVGPRHGKGEGAMGPRPPGNRGSRGRQARDTREEATAVRGQQGRNRGALPRREEGTPTQEGEEWDMARDSRDQPSEGSQRGNGKTQGHGVPTMSPRDAAPDRLPGRAIPQAVRQVLVDLAARGTNR